jgi:hypothetical protein
MDEDPTEPIGANIVEREAESKFGGRAGGAGNKVPMASQHVGGHGDVLDLVKGTVTDGLGVMHDYSIGVNQRGYADGMSGLREAHDGKGSAQASHGLKGPGDAAHPNYGPEPKPDGPGKINVQGPANRKCMRQLNTWMAKCVLVSP